MRIFLDSERCTGHGRCYSLAPQLFEGDDRGYGVVLSQEVPPASEDQARIAVQSCPEGSISTDSIPAAE